MIKGFITIATGKEEYYRLAYNLLCSYRYFCSEPLPFAILADRENAYTEAFDDVIIFPDGATNSYLDKLCLAEFAPYDTTIFIDADCLAYGDLNTLFAHFEDADDFSCFGRVLPLDDKTGWFEYENLGELKDKVTYVVGLHGGIYYIRKTQAAKQTLQTAKALVPDYPKFRFKGKFDTPGDEPLVALAMALNGMRPIPFIGSAICCYWEHEGKMKVDISRGLAATEQELRIALLHWGTRFTRELLYKEQIALLTVLEKDGTNAASQLWACKAKYGLAMLLERVKRFGLRVKNKLLRVMGWKK